FDGGICQEFLVGADHLYIGVDRLCEVFLAFPHRIEFKARVYMDKGCVEYATGHAEGADSRFDGCHAFYFGEANIWKSVWQLICVWKGMIGYGNFYLGTSGLVLPVPNKQHFPEEFKAGTRLSYYASLFNSIEVNSSFYKVPRPAT